jgi:hypothetical protein
MRCYARTAALEIKWLRSRQPGLLALSGRMTAPWNLNGHAALCSIGSSTIGDCRSGVTDAYLS